ncbi:MAG TPA: hypothetical protein VGT05_00955 [Patescibacteria group bacterium]|nr:hypothetical protein [Patescibacteria group bacterium]
MIYIAAAMIATISFFLALFSLWKEVRKTKYEKITRQELQKERVIFHSSDPF